MSTIHLYDNKTGAWAGATAAGAQFTLGVPFTPLLTVSVNQLRWYRPATGAGFAPTRLCLWDVPTNALIADPAVPDDGAVGWQSVDLASPVTLIGGREYRVSQTIAAGVSIARSSTGARGTAPYPLAFTANLRCWASGFAYPSNVDSPDALGVDITTDSEGLGAVPGDLATAADVANGLAAWLSDSDGTHADSAPLLTLAEVIDSEHGLAAIRTAIDDEVVGALVDGTSGLAAIRTAETGLDTKVGSAAGLDFASLFAGLAELWTRTATLVAGSAELLTRVPTTIGASIAYLIGQSTGTEGSAVGALSARSGFPTDLWTMVDTVDFVQAKSWDVPADLYTLSTSDWPVHIRQTMVDGAPWRPRLGWWAPRNGDLFGARRFVDWEASILEDGGRRMQGVVVWLEPSTAGTLQAWRLT